MSQCTMACIAFDASLMSVLVFSACWTYVQYSQVLGHVLNPSSTDRYCLAKGTDRSAYLVPHFRNLRGRGSVTMGLSQLNQLDCLRVLEQLARGIAGAFW